MPAPHYRMIVDDQNGDWFAHGWTSRVAGIGVGVAGTWTSTTMVPGRADDREPSTERFHAVAHIAQPQPLAVHPRRIKALAVILHDEADFVAGPGQWSSTECASLWRATLARASCATRKRPSSTSNGVSPLARDAHLSGNAHAPRPVGGVLAEHGVQPFAREGGGPQSADQGDQLLLGLAG